MNERLESVNVRNLEQIQESDSGRRSSRLGAFVLASLAGAALVATAVLVLEKNSRRRKRPPIPSPR